MKPVYSDFWLTARYAFIMQYGPALPMPSEVHGKQLQMGVIEKDDFGALWTIPKGYVVTGGSRGAGIGMFSVLNLKGNTPPPSWRLLKEIDRPLGERRLEPLRIWEVTPARDGAGER